MHIACLHKNGQNQSLKNHLSGGIEIVIMVITVRSHGIEQCSGRTAAASLLC